MKKTSIVIPIIALIGIIILIFLFFIFDYSQSENYNQESVKLIRVIDGDTFEYNGKIIRLLCVDTPEKGEKGYEEAKTFLDSLLANRENISIKEYGFDIYNRTLAYVYTSNISANKEIIENGFGKLFPYGNNTCEEFR